MTKKPVIEELLDIRKESKKETLRKSVQRFKRPLIISLATSLVAAAGITAYVHDGNTTQSDNVETNNTMDTSSAPISELEALTSIIQDPNNFEEGLNIFVQNSEWQSYGDVNGSPLNPESVPSHSHSAIEALQSLALQNLADGQGRYARLYILNYRGILGPMKLLAIGNTEEDCKLYVSQMDEEYAPFSYSHTDLQIDANLSNHEFIATNIQWLATARRMSLDHSMAKYDFGLGDTLYAMNINEGKTTIYLLSNQQDNTRFEPLDNYRVDFRFQMDQDPVYFYVMQVPYLSPDFTPPRRFGPGRPTGDSSE